MCGAVVSLSRVAGSRGVISARHSNGYARCVLISDVHFVELALTSLKLQRKSFRRRETFRREQGAFKLHIWHAYVFVIVDVFTFSMM